MLFLCPVYCLVMLTFRTEVLNANMLMILLVMHSVAAGVMLCLLGTISNTFLTSDYSFAQTNLKMY